MSLSLKNDYAKGRTNSMFWSENIHNFVLLFNLKTFFFIIAVGVVKKSEQNRFRAVASILDKTRFFTVI